MEKAAIIGRPSTYTAEIAEEICEQMANGKGLRQICTTDDMPSRTTVLRWLESNADFRGQYARARESLMDFYSEEILKIAFDDSGDFFIEKDKKGRDVVIADHARVQRARLKVDTLKWIMSKLAPRRYGNEPDAPPIEAPIVKITRTIVDPKEHGQRPPEPAQPLQIGYTPKLPAPDAAIPATVQERLRRILETRVPSNMARTSWDILDEVCGVIDAALAAHEWN